MQGISASELDDLKQGLADSAAGNVQDLGSFAKYVEPTSWHKAILRGLQGRKLYEGTVPFSTVQDRRAKNKAARHARRVNRLHRKH
jgi:hypothetical protein